METACHSYFIKTFIAVIAGTLFLQIIKQSCSVDVHLVALQKQTSLKSLGRQNKFHWALSCGSHVLFWVKHRQIAQKYIFILFDLPLSGVRQMGLNFAQEEYVEVNDALAALLTLYSWYSASTVGISCQPMALTYVLQLLKSFQEKHASGINDKLDTQDRQWLYIAQSLFSVQYVLLWTVHALLHHESWGNSSCTTPPLHNQFLSGDIYCRLRHNHPTSCTR